MCLVGVIVADSLAICGLCWALELLSRRSGVYVDAMGGTRALSVTLLSSTNLSLEASKHFYFFKLLLAQGCSVFAVQR